MFPKSLGGYNFTISHACSTRNVTYKNPRMLSPLQVAYRLIRYLPLVLKGSKKCTPKTRQDAAQHIVPVLVVPNASCTTAMCPCVSHRSWVFESLATVDYPTFVMDHITHE